MSYDDELDEEITDTQPLDPNIRKQLREAEKIRKEAESLRAELEAQRREVQFTKAGIPDSGLGALFRKAYDGEATAESIRRAAEEYGILQGAPQAPDTSLEEIEALRRAQGSTVGNSGQFPDSSQQYLSALSEAMTPEEIMAVVESEVGKRLGLNSSRLAH